MTTVDIHKIATLSKIKLDDNQEKSLLDALNKTFSMIEKMNDVNTDNIQPLAHPLDIQQRLREDIPSTDNEKAYLQQHAPKYENGFILVNEVLE